MVEHRQVDRFGGECQAAGEQPIVGARGRIAAGMVVRQDHACAAVSCGVGNHVAEGKGGTANVAVMAGKVDAPCLIIDMRNPQMFFVRAGFGEAAGKEAPGGVEAVQLQR